MFELRHAIGNTWWVECPARIGIVQVSESEVVLIDAGSDQDAGRKIRKILNGKGWNLRAIYVTHSNADHIGGCAYLQKQYGCPVYARGMEQAFTEYPILEPSFLYGGYPPKELCHKFLMAKPSECSLLTEEVLPAGFELVELPGHFLDMVGIRTPDDVLFLADCLSGRKTLEKYRIGFIYDVEAYLKTLEKLGSLSAALFIPAHAEVTSSPEELKQMAELNRRTVLGIRDDILSFLHLDEKPKSFEEILAFLFDHYGLVMTWEQYVLIGSTIRSYLAWMMNQKQVKAVFEKNVLRFLPAV